jgi:hypothetical protein
MILPEIYPEQHDPVGKRMGSIRSGTLFVHRSAAPDVIPIELLEQAPAGMDWTIAKFDLKDHRIEFISVPGFDTENEPVRGRAWSNGTYNRRGAGSAIYHSKWMMVHPDYEGFDYEEAKKRTAIWKRIIRQQRIPFVTIGSKKLWDEMGMDWAIRAEIALERDTP